MAVDHYGSEGQASCPLLRYGQVVPAPSKVPARVTAAGAVQITTVWRVTAVFLGLAGLGAGGVAVFVTHLEAGPVALLIVGLVLLLIGIGGRLPSRLRVGDNEAAWDAVETFVERLTEDATPSGRPDLLEALDDLAEAAPQLAGSAISAIAYANLIFEMLSAAVMRLNQLDEEAVPGFTLQRDQNVTTMTAKTIRG
jgi:hypothetical protein